MVFPEVSVQLGVGVGWVLGEDDLGDLILGAGTDVTADVLERDGITITRGRPDEGSQVETSRCSLTFRNNSGNYSPRNPAGAYFGQLGRNTPILVSVEGDLRFAGVVPAWPVTWDRSGADVTATVEAVGVMRRLSQQSSGVLESSLRRGVETLTDAVGYWPCEDAAGSTSLASGLSGHPSIPYNVIGGSEAAAFDGFAASAPIPTVGTGVWRAAVPPYSAINAAVQVRMLLAVPAAGLAADSSLFLMDLPGASAFYWQLRVSTAGALRLRAFDSDFVEVHDTGDQAFGVNGKLLWLSVGLEQNGADVDMEILTLEVGASAATGFTDTLSGETIGRPNQVMINSSFTDWGNTAVGHILVQDGITSLHELSDQLNAYAGEVAATRLLRLAPEENITVALIGTAADTAAMGPQGQAVVLDLMRECADADMGILYEPRDLDGLTYRTRADLYAQEPTLTLDYEAREVWVIESTDDDQQTRNDVTVKREGGSSARAVDEDGTLGVETIGRYSTETTLNLQSDSQLPDQASWRLHLGATDEARYPRLGANLASTAFTSDAAQTAAALALDLGDKIRVTNPPAWLPPDNIEQIAQGLTETIRPGEWTIEATCTPARPWDVGVLDGTGAGEFRLDSAGSWLASAVTSTATSLSVDITDGSLWSTTAPPFDVMIGGERITVTAVSGASSPQTFTVTRSVNGVVKAHEEAAVSLFKPAYLAL